MIINDGRLDSGNPDASVISMSTLEARKCLAAIRMISWIHFHGTTMNFLGYTQLALEHSRNSFAETLYLRSGIDITRPVSIYGLINQRCNYKCRYCEYWRKSEYAEEMSIEEWQAALLSLKKFIGPFHIEFSGGEPFIKKGFMDLTQWCHSNGVQWGVTTNGSLLSEENIHKVVQSRPFNMNISIDSHISEIHDHVRGIPGSLERIANGLSMLLREREREHLNFPIIIKPVVHRLNFQTLPKTVEWVTSLGPMLVSFQPVEKFTTEAENDLWIESGDIEELKSVIGTLLKMKKSGAPIVSSEVMLKSLVSHFLGQSAPIETLPCRVGLRNFLIRPDGSVETCWFFPPIGNLKHQSAKDTWTSPEARKQRLETVRCQKLCLSSCLSQRTFMDKVKMGLALLARSK
jgi:radical SAM protein with 4Fe4S-binding SPASM domain